MTPWKMAMEAAAQEMETFLPGVLSIESQPAVAISAHILRALPEPPEFRAAREAEVEMLREAANVLRSADAVLIRVRGRPAVAAAVVNMRAADVLSRLEERLK